MPLKLVRIFRRKNHRATSNISELESLTSNSLNSNDAQAGSFAPGLINSNIGAIHGSVFSNNQFNQIHHHHHHPQAEDDADYAEIKVRDIILETELRSGDIHHDLQPDGTMVEIGRIRKYTGRLLQQPHGSIFIHKYEGLATRAWKRDFDVLSAVRHPNIIQLYGLCYARNFTALIFHNVQKTAFRKYHLSLSGPLFVTYFDELMDQLQSAIDALHKHGLGLQTPHLPDHNVNYAGHLVVDTFAPECWVFRPFSSLLSSTPHPKALASTFKDQPLTRSLLVEYYDLLKLVCLLYTERSTTNHVSITHKGITTKLRPPLPYIARTPWGSQQTLVKIAWISNMLRWTIPISQPLRWPIMQEMVIEVQTQKSSGHSSSPLFHVLASQIHHIIGTMKTDASGVKTAVPYYMDFYCEEIKPSTPLPYDSLYLWHALDHPDYKNHWWSTDPEGQIPISTTVVEGASDVLFFANLWSCEIPQQIYPILWDIHKACGFDPDSTEMAEYLGYPLLELKADSESVLHEFGPSQESDQPSHSGYESEVESDDVSSSSHETFVSALSED